MNKKKYFNLFAIIMVLTTSVSNAIPIDSNPVKFPGGVIYPNRSLSITLSTNQLVLNRYYKITCTIENNAYSKTYPAVLKMNIYFSGASGISDGEAGTILLNDKALNMHQGVLNRSLNSYVVTYAAITGRSGQLNPRLFLEFENYDTTDAVTVNNCEAAYVVGEQ